MRLRGRLMENSNDQEEKWLLHVHVHVPTLHDHMPAPRLSWTSLHRTPSSAVSPPLTKRGGRSDSTRYMADTTLAVTGRDTERSVVEKYGMAFGAHEAHRGSHG